MKKEVIGVFKATNGGRKSHLVYVSQEIQVNRQKVITDARKVFNLDSLDGQKVRSTVDPDIFLLEDGTILKKQEKYPLVSCNPNNPCNVHSPENFMSLVYLWSRPREAICYKGPTGAASGPL